MSGDHEFSIACSPDAVGAMTDAERSLFLAVVMTDFWRPAILPEVGEMCLGNRGPIVSMGGG